MAGFFDYLRMMMGWSSAQGTAGQAVDPVWLSVPGNRTWSSETGNREWLEVPGNREWLSEETQS